jgi:hypothetical protein
MLLLGVFEFIAVAKLLTANESEIVEKHSGLSPLYFVTDPQTRLLWCAWLMTLGFQRVSWALGNRNFGSWLCLIGTHMSEAIMFWSFALLTKNPNNLSFPDFFQQLIQQKIVDTYSTFVLLFVPALVVYFLLCGPGDNKSGAEKKSKKA